MPRDNVTWTCAAALALLSSGCTLWPQPGPPAPPPRTLQAAQAQPVVLPAAVMEPPPRQSFTCRLEASLSRSQPTQTPSPAASRNASGSCGD